LGASKKTPIFKFFISSSLTFIILGVKNGFSLFGTVAGAKLESFPKALAVSFTNYS
jgi:hypothetical protein